MNYITKLAQTSLKPIPPAMDQSSPGARNVTTMEWKNQGTMAPATGNINEKPVDTKDKALGNFKDLVKKQKPIGFAAPPILNQ